MKKIPIKIVSTQPQDTLHVRFSPTDICNFKCSYCIGSIDGKIRYPKNIDTVIKNFKLLFNMYKIKRQKTRFHMFITGGGEPTLWPHLRQFCTELKEEFDVFITIVTNGSRTLAYWKNNHQYLDDAVMSYHYEYTKLKHYVNVADFLFENGIKVVSAVLMDANQWDNCVSIIEQMKSTSKHPWFIEPLTIISGEQGVNVYTKEQKEYMAFPIKRIPTADWLVKWFDRLRIYQSVVEFEDGTIELAKSNHYIINSINNFKGWSCDIGLEHLTVGVGGTVEGTCQEPLFKGKKFNIFSEDFYKEFNESIELSPIICSQNSCDCLIDTHATKRAI